MDMTVAVGKVLSQQLVEEEGEDDDGNATVDMSFATVAGADRTMDLDEDEDEDEDATGAMQVDDRTSNMVEATTHGGILSLAVPASSIAAPSTPTARLQAQIFSRQSTGAAISASPRPNSPRRIVAPTRSPTKPLPSPRRIASPTKPAPGSPATPRRAGRASMSPIKKPATPNFGAAPPGGLTNSARRTPGGSLSLKGLMEEQRKLAQAPPTESPKPPVQRRWDSPRGAGASRVEEMRAEQAVEDDSTGSSFGLYGDEVRSLFCLENDACSHERQDNVPQIKSLDAFFQATEMHFHKDISGFAGVEFANKSRKSMVPQEDGRERAFPSSTYQLDWADPRCLEQRAGRRRSRTTSSQARVRRFSTACTDPCVFLWFRSS